MADKKTEKERLMEKVFGKDAPNRRLTEEDMELLKNNILDLESLSPEWKSIKDIALKVFSPLKTGQLFRCRSGTAEK